MRAGGEALLKKTKKKKMKKRRRIKIIYISGVWVAIPSSSSIGKGRESHGKKKNGEKNLLVLCSNSQRRRGGEIKRFSNSKKKRKSNFPFAREKKKTGIVNPVGKNKETPKKVDPAPGRKGGEKAKPCFHSVSGGKERGKTESSPSRSYTKKGEKGGGGSRFFLGEKEGGREPDLCNAAML